MRRIRKAGLAVLCCGYWLLLAASAQAADMEIHDHKSRDIGDYPEPQIAINIYRDPIDGVNLHIELERYRIGVAVFTRRQPVAERACAPVY